jgi:uroporphyrinogen-III synthase
MPTTDTLKGHAPQGPLILVTRPKDDAGPFATALKARGMEVLLEPLMTIHPEEGAKPRILSLMKEKPRALLITSANGIRAFAASSAQRDVPVFAVGEASAEEARRLGFGTVTASEGNAARLAALVQANVKPAEGVLVHIAGSVTRGELKEQLTQAGYAVERVTAYHAEPVSHISGELKSALVNCELSFATFFSPRTLSIFERLMEIGGLSYLLRHVELVALSEDILPTQTWKNRQTAAAPTTKAMLDLIDRLQSGRMRREGKG